MTRDLHGVESSWILSLWWDHSATGWQDDVWLTIQSVSACTLVLQKIVHLDRLSLLVVCVFVSVELPDDLMLELLHRLLSEILSVHKDSDL